MAGKKRMKLASRGKRFLAFLIDIVPSWVIMSLFMTSVMQFIESGFGSYGHLDYGYNAGLDGAGYFLFFFLAFFIVQIVFWCQGRSIGKAIFGMRVVSSHDGNKLGPWMMLLREVIVKKASSVLLLGYIWILIDDYNRSWHDKILETYVVDERATIRAGLNSTYPDGGEAPEAEPSEESAAYSGEQMTAHSADDFASSHSEAGAEAEADSGAESGHGTNDPENSTYSVLGASYFDDCDSAEETTSCEAASREPDLETEADDPIVVQELDLEEIEKAVSEVEAELMTDFEQGSAPIDYADNEPDISRIVIEDPFEKYRNEDSAEKLEISIEEDEQNAVPVAEALDDVSGEGVKAAKISFKRLI